MPHLNREERLEYYKKHNMKRYKTEEYKTYIRNYALKTLYGMSPNDYDAMLKDQNYCCAVCLKHHTNFKKRLSVDHNHETNQIRGLLCTGCNKFIISNRTVEFFERVLNYMKNSKHKGNQAVGRGT